MEDKYIQFTVKFEKPCLVNFTCNFVQSVQATLSRADRVGGFTGRSSSSARLVAAQTPYLVRYSPSSLEACLEAPPSWFESACWVAGLFGIESSPPPEISEKK